MPRLPENSEGNLAHWISSVKTESGTLSKGRIDPGRLRVLLVEDEQPIRDVVVRWLFEEGFDWREAADGRAAMGLLASGTKIDLVLSNMLLPVVDGFELLLQVKERYPHVPFAFVTAINVPELRDEAMLKGAAGYLLKPFSREQFLEFVRKVLSEHPSHGKGLR
jgi:CheY-like chemotaxis protein